MPITNAPSQHPIDREFVEAHGPAMYRLARALLGNDHDAEEVVQQTWVAAATGGHAAHQAETWLLGVTRNLSRRLIRSRRRVRGRERRFAPAEALQSSADVVAETELLQQIRALVAGLPEPYRSTLTRRYLEDLAADEIARQDAVAPATVRSRMMRGLQRLRRRLESDPRFGDGRWAMVLAPLVIADRSKGPGPDPGGAAPTRFMRVGSWVGLTLIVASLWWWASSSADRNTPDLVGSTEVLEPRPLGPAPELPPGPESSRLPFVAVVTDDRPAPSFPAPHHLTGQVVDPQSRPVPGARVELQPRIPLMQLAPYVVTDDQGRFTCSIEEPIRGVVARAGELGCSGLYEPPGSMQPFVLMVTGTGVAVGGRLIDPSGQPLPHALVRLGSPVPQVGLGVVGVDQHALEPSPCMVVRSDDHGRFLLEGVPVGVHELLAVHPAGAPTTATIDVPPMGREDLQITMKPGFRLRGFVRDSQGRAVAGAWVGQFATDLARYVGDFSAADGSFLVSGLDPGGRRLVAGGDAGIAVRRLSASPDTGEDVSWFPVLLPGRRLEVEVCDASGSPLPDREVHVEWSGGSGTELTDALRWTTRVLQRSRGWTDGEGRVEFQHPHRDAQARVEIRDGLDQVLASQRVAATAERVNLSLPLPSEPIGPFRLLLQDSSGEVISPTRVHVRWGGLEAVELSWKQDESGALCFDSVPAMDAHWFAGINSQHLMSLGRWNAAASHDRRRVVSVAEPGRLRVRWHAGSVPWPGFYGIHLVDAGRMNRAARLVSFEAGSQTVELRAGRYHAVVPGTPRRYSPGFEIRSGQLHEVRWCLDDFATGTE